MWRNYYKIYLLILLLIPLFVLTIKNIGKLNSEAPSQLKTMNDSFKNIKEPHIVFKNSWIIFFVDFEDFSCPACEHQVIYLLKWVDKHLSLEEKQSLLVFLRKHSENQQYDKWFITNWIEENQINVQLKFDTESLFNTLKIHKSSLALLNRNDYSLIDFKEFPMVKNDLVSITKVLENTINNKK